MALKGATEIKLLDTAFTVARDYKDYGRYDSDISACKSLKRRCKGYAALQYEEALQKGIHLLATAKEIVARDCNSLREKWKASPQQNPLTLEYSDLEAELRSRCPDFDSSTHKFALQWVIFWHHLK